MEVDAVVLQEEDDFDDCSEMGEEKETIIDPDYNPNQSFIQYAEDDEQDQADFDSWVNE